MTIRDLLRGALRMRPDRIVIGEVRGGEALDLLMALNTGHEGALSTVHANSPEDALRRVETLALMAGVGLPHEAIREQLGRGLDLVIHLARLSDGSRRVVEVAEVVRTAGLGRGARSSSGWEARRRDGGGRSGPDRAAPRWPAGCAPVAVREAMISAPRLASLAARGVNRPAAPGRARGLCAERRGAAAPRAARQRRDRGRRRSWSPVRGRWRWPRPPDRGASEPSSRGRRERYRRAVERSVPDVAAAIADAISGGHSVRGALAAAAESLEGPSAAELAGWRPTSSSALPPATR